MADTAGDDGEAMLSRLKTIDQTHDGAPLAIHLGGAEMLLDPAGVAILQAERALIVSDLHLEKGSSFARKGIFLPPYDTAATLARLGALVAKHDPKIIISLGDSFHDADACNRLDGSAVEAIHSMASGRNLLWVTGNHDPEPPTGVPGDCADSVALGGITLRHIPLAGERGGEISGHLHPHAVLRVRGKRVRRPCFASDGSRMIMPAFGVFTGGLDLGDSAFAGLFDRANLCAHMLGSREVYPVPASRLMM